MLIDIDFYDKAQNPKIQMVDAWTGGLTLQMEDPTDIGEIIQLEVARPYGETGVYWASSALEHFLDLYSDYEAIPDYKRTFATFDEHWKYLQEWGKGYGVADNVEQIKEAFPQYWFDARTFILTISPVYKSQQPPRDGWRWEKWGPYIGTQNSRADYLYDEPEIEEILVFSLVEVVPKTIPF